MVAGKRSRRAKVAQSDEEEEEDIEMSQAQTQSQSQSRVSVKQSKSAVKASKSRKRKVEPEPEPEPQEEDEEDQEEEEEMPVFDADEFRRTNQPLEGQLIARKLESFDSDWKAMEDFFEQTLPTVHTIGVALADNDRADKEDPKHDVDAAMRSLLDSQKELEVYRAVLNGMKKEVARGGQIDDAEELYEKTLKKRLNEYRNQTSRKKYSDHPLYTKFRTETWEASKGTAMPPMKELIAREDGDSEDGSDIEVGGSKQNYKCPLTLKQFKDPMTSRVCKHSFERSAIMDYFKKGPARCPTPGCPQTLSLADFKADEDLARRAKNDEKRRKRREAEAEDEEMEEVV